MKSTFFDFPVFQLAPAPAGESDLEGEGRRRVLLVTWQHEATNLDLDYAGKIVGAVGMSLPEDLYTYMKTPGENTRLSGLARQLGIREILVFGPAPDELGFHFRHRRYEPLRVGPHRLLFADSLEHLRAERAAGRKQLATALWKALQALFPKDGKP